MSARRIAAGAALALVAFAFLFLRPAETPGPFLRDFEAYYAAGATWRGEGDAYGREIWRVERHIPGVVATREELLPFVGPPYTLPFWALFGGLFYGAAAPVWCMVLGVAGLLLGFCILRMADIRDATGVAGLVLLGASFGPLTSALALGQIALVSCAGVVATTLALRSAGTRAVVVILSACLAALQPNLAVPLVARLCDRRAWLALGIAALALVASAVAALGGIPQVERYLSVLAAHAAAERTIAIQVTVAAIAYGFGTSESASRWIAVGIAAAVVVTTALLLRSPAYAPHARVAVASAALPLALPFSHEHDLTIALFPAVLCIRRAHGIAWLTMACATVAIAVDWLGLAQRPSGIPQSVALAIAATLAIVALSVERLSWRTAAPLALALCVLPIGAWAAHHPVPVWPYALGPAFDAPLNLDATAVWRLEQIRTGLATANATSAALRALSLTGCTLLWLTSLAVLRGPNQTPLPE